MTRTSVPNENLKDQLFTFFIRFHKLFFFFLLQVTIFGESAGGGSVCHQMTLQGASGLFTRVISQVSMCSRLTSYQWLILQTYSDYTIRSVLKGTFGGK